MLFLLAGEAEKGGLLKQIHEVLPGYGDAFLLACLDSCGYKPERVIAQLLEGNLPRMSLLTLSMFILPLSVSHTLLLNLFPLYGVTINLRCSDQGLSLLLLLCSCLRFVLRDAQRLSTSQPTVYTTCFLNQNSTTARPQLVTLPVIGFQMPI